MKITINMLKIKVVRYLIYLKFFYYIQKHRINELSHKKRSNILFRIYRTNIKYSNNYLNLNIKDAIMFIYKKSIFDIVKNKEVVNCQKWKI